jgi:hypothetical protein
MIGYTDGDVVRQDYLSCVYVSVPVGVKQLVSHWRDFVILYSEYLY